MENVFDEKLGFLLLAGESDTLEFKSKVPSASVLAREISAFANTKGGQIILGVHEQGQVVGIDPNHARAIFDEAQKLISPHVSCSIAFPKVDGKVVAVIELPSMMSPLFNALPSGNVFQRRGSSTVPISANHIVAKLKQVIPEQTSDAVTEAHIAKLALSIETLNAKLETANSWKSKFRDMVVGGVIGALLSLVLAGLLSLL